jgi:Methylase of polypeptide chain release factors
MNKADVLFNKVDVLSYTPTSKAYDVIVSNPPYITQMEKADMKDNVLNWEPFLALFVDNDDPLLFYKRIAAIGKLMLREQGRVYFEINRSYGLEIKVMLESLGYSGVEIRKDCFGNDRMIKAVV